MLVSVKPLVQNVLIHFFIALILSIAVESRCHIIPQHVVLKKHHSIEKSINTSANLFPQARLQSGEVRAYPAFTSTIVPLWTLLLHTFMWGLVKPLFSGPPLYGRTWILSGVKSTPCTSPWGSTHCPFTSWTRTRLGKLSSEVSSISFHFIQSQVLTDGAWQLF